MNVSDQIKEHLQKSGFSFVETLYYFSERQLMWSDFYSNGKVAIIIDYNICCKTPKIFDYELYTQKQNDYVYTHEHCLWFLSNNDFESFRNSFLKLTSSTQLIETPDEMSNQFGDLHLDSTVLEHDFEKRFEEVYGIDALGYLQREVALSDINGRQIFVDFALSTNNGMLAVEENGVTFHHPQLIGEEAYQRQLDKPNALSLFGYRIYRFSSLDIRNTEKLNSNIQRFFGPKDHFKATTGFLATRNVQLYDHQVEALSQIRRDRELGKRVSLIVFPTASGQSQITEEDVLSLLAIDSSLRICIVAPSIAVVDDWTSRMLGVVERSGLKISVGRSIDDQMVVSN